MSDTSEELQFLRFYRQFMKNLFAEGGTDEDYWATEAYQEKYGKPAPGVEE